MNVPDFVKERILKIDRFIDKADWVEVTDLIKKKKHKSYAILHISVDDRYIANYLIKKIKNRELYPVKKGITSGYNNFYHPEHVSLHCPERLDEDYSLYINQLTNSKKEQSVSYVRFFMYSLKQKMGKESLNWHFEKDLESGKFSDLGIYFQSTGIPGFHEDVSEAEFLEFVKKSIDVNDFLNIYSLTEINVQKTGEIFDVRIELSPNPE